MDKKVNEESINGLKITDNIKKDNEKNSKDYHKEFDKKMKDFEGAMDDNEMADGIKFSTGHDEDDKEFHDTFEIRNGMERLKYDNEPSKEFKERAIKAIKGDTTLGNKGEKGGNTEPFWGSSSEDFADKLIDSIKVSDKREKEATPTYSQFGDDIEMRKGPNVGASRSLAISEDFKASKRVKFKHDFKDINHVMESYPNEFKTDGMIIEMVDSDNLYTVKWDEKINEAVILRHYDKKLVTESFDKVNHLSTYKKGGNPSKVTLNEDSVMKNILNTTRKFRNEL